MTFLLDAGCSDNVRSGSRLCENGFGGTRRRFVKKCGGLYALPLLCKDSL